MKVVYLNPAGQLGGAEKALLDILASLKDILPAFRPHLIVSADGPLVAKAKALGVSVTIAPFPPALARLGDGGAGGPAGLQISRMALLKRLLGASSAAARYLHDLRRTLNELSPDLIYTNGLKMHLLGLWARPRRTPVVWHIHDYVSSRPLMAGLMRRCSGRCAAIIANSNSVASDMRRLCGENASVQTIYNGVDLNVYTPFGPRLDLDELASMPPAPQEVVRVGMFATMARWKGHEVFLRSLSLLPPESPIRAYIIGDALYQTDGSQYSISELRRMAEDLGVADRVGFTGFISEPAAAMRACDVVVHASTRPEPFGLVIVEAMACGRAVIASNAGGAAELIEAGHDALTHRPGDAKDLAEKITTLAFDLRLSTSIGVAARATVERRFNRARLGMELLPIYRALIAKPSAAVVTPVTGS
jgi:glycosyltransferase involved in cell wall biosynthesis